MKLEGGCGSGTQLLAASGTMHPAVHAENRAPLDILMPSSAVEHVIPSVRTNPRGPYCWANLTFYLAHAGWEYSDISIEAYPEKRADMLKIADRLTVPQIFFNDEHVGGEAVDQYWLG